MPTVPPSGSPTLLLFPTELERHRFMDRGGLPFGCALPHICGFGPVAAAARTSHLIAQLKPARVILCGIAGTYDQDRYPVGEAVMFGRVAIDGVGAGQGEEHVLPPALGFPQWPGSDDTRVEPVETELPLIRDVEPTSDSPLLLTTCAASISDQEARVRLTRYPDAIAEDMEGFAVAMSCALSSTPLTIIRGFSNVVGDRNSSNWRIPSALYAARAETLRCLESTE
ncbi:MAG: futalosine hydrolase [Planctomycetota bacterium]|jgi:futalosine hydrolase